MIPCHAQSEVEKRVYDTRRTGTPPVIDGVLDDDVWDLVPWSGDFVQWDPDEGEPPSRNSFFKVVYDDEALYFAFRLEDDPALVSSLLARRDRFPGDWIEVNIDSYRDRRTAGSFTFSLSGARGDEFVSGDGDSWDSKWDPVWGGAARIDEQGWTAETRIPLSQLRFTASAEQTWGLQVTRRIFRLEERSTWQRIPRETEGWVSQFGELRGLENLEPRRRLEVVPYLVGRLERSAGVAGDPYRTGQDDRLDGGLDGKVGLTPNLTVDFTVNPDFGQVEADPSEVNLSAFETFFDERRPFFIERQELFDLRLAPATTGGPFTSDRLFYSRRIGRPPRYEPGLPSGATSIQPESTTILGAFKLTGTTAGGLSIGLLDAITDREEARIDLDGTESRLTVEPLTNAFVGRLRQDFRDGDTQVGGMVTALHRRLEDHLEGFTSSAWATGVDLSTLFADRDYRFEGSLFASRIEGSEAAIARVQRSPARYYQRPDHGSESFDPTRTALSGHAGSLRIERTSNHDLRFQTGVAWRSPGFEINDLGFLRDAGRVNQFGWVGYTKRNSGRFERWNLNANQWLDWDESGRFLGARLNVNANAQLQSKVNGGVSLGWEDSFISLTELRGGPSSRWPALWETSFWLNSDGRKDLFVAGGATFEQGDEGSGDFVDGWLELRYRPSGSLTVTLRPEVFRRRRRLQYVDTLEIDDEPRYLFGRLDQKTFLVSLRVDYAITPNLTVQYYGAPFASTGRYDELKRITDPLAGRFRDRWAPYASDQLGTDPESGEILLDENRDGVVDARIRDPDFDFRELNSNLVLRWEWSPGSTLFLVWSQARTDDELLPGELGASRDFDQLFAAEPKDVFLLKISKWISR